MIGKSIGLCSTGFEISLLESIAFDSILSFEFSIAKFVFVIFAPVPIRFKVHNDIFDIVAHRGLIPTTLYVLGLLVYIPEHNDTKVGNSKCSPSGR